MAEQQQSLFEHLAELRTRIIYALIALVVGVGVGLYFSQALFNFIIADIVKEAAEGGTSLIQLSPADTFMVQLRLGIITGIILAIPVILYQIAAFVLPALSGGERALLWVLLPGMVFLFGLGWSFGWFVVLPITRRFLEGFATASGVATTFTPRTYVDFIMGINNPLGIVFQLPLVVLILSKIGLVTARFLRRVWKYAVLVIFILAAFISPPTIIDQILLAIPMLILYEISIWLARLVEKKRNN